MPKTKKWYTKTEKRHLGLAKPLGNLGNCLRPPNEKQPWVLIESNLFSKDILRNERYSWLIKCNTHKNLGDVGLLISRPVNPYTDCHIGFNVRMAASKFTTLLVRNFAANKPPKSSRESLRSTLPPSFAVRDIRSHNFVISSMEVIMKNHQGSTVRLLSTGKSNNLY